MSANYDQRSNLKMPVGLALATRTATASTAAIDTLDWEALTFASYAGIGGITFDATNKLELIITHSDDDVTYTAVGSDDVIQGYGQSFGTGGVVRSFTAAKAAADTLFDLVGYRGKKRYVKAAWTFSGTHGTGTPCSLHAIQGKPAHKPTWQSNVET